MNSSLPSLARQSTRFGFHYFQDNQHYREKDLKTWLPVLQSLDVSWLVLPATMQRAIPEFFLKPLLESHIEAILQFNLPLSNLPDEADLETLFEAYAHWGVKGIILAEQPNSRKSWHASIWSRDGLVDRFLDSYLPLARRALRAGLVPILPPLEPGGDLWDTVFLRSMLESMVDRGENELLGSLVLSSFAWTFDHSLNWGVGGAAQWPDARPYNRSISIQDQRGFRCHEWYQGVCQTVLGRSVPIVLLGAGLIKNPMDKNAVIPDPEMHSTVNLAIGRLLAGQAAYEPDDPGTPLKTLPDEVVCGSFWLLSADPSSAQSKYAWFRLEGSDLPVVADWQKWLVGQPDTRQHTTFPVSINEEAKWNKTSNQFLSRAHPIRNYLLLPSEDWVIEDHKLDLFKPYIQKFHPAIGFSVAEASLAREVTIVGSDDKYSQLALQDLKEAGCLVNRIDGDGTMIATVMGER